MNLIKRIIVILLSMGGILVDKITPSRIFLLLTLASIYLLYRWFFEAINLSQAILLFGIVFLIRYIFLFTSFVENGIAYNLKKRFGEARGFEVYKIITALLFFLSASNFSLMIYKTQLNLSFFNIYNSLTFTIGAAFMLTGIIVNVWSTHLVGIDVYYYKDLFIGRPVGEFNKSGPYKVFSNPMYGIGQANGYGSAIIYDSAAGIGGIMLNQVMMYIFYFTIEKPHIKKTFGKNPIHSPLAEEL